MYCSANDHDVDCASGSVGKMRTNLEALFFKYVCMHLLHVLSPLLFLSLSLACSLSVCVCWASVV